MMMMMKMYKCRKPTKSAENGIVPAGKGVFLGVVRDRARKIMKIMKRGKKWKKREKEGRMVGRANL